MIMIKNLTIKNFLSVGAITQTVELNTHGLTLVLGENLDLGGAGSRNGVGKSTMFSALSYALYGQAISNIKKDNLINSINKKNMVVSVEFEKDGTAYRIERGRKPNFFKFYVNNQTVGESSNDEAQGENRETQRSIDQLLGLSWSMFRHIVCLNTYTEPFLSMGAGKQREVIEELLGITLLSHKADSLRELIKLTRTKIEQEEFRIHTLKSSNQRILNTIADLDKQALSWNNDHNREIQQLMTALEDLTTLDIDAEIAAHRQNQIWAECNTALTNISKQLNSECQRVSQLHKQQAQLADQYAQLENHNCPMCGSHMHDSKHTELLSSVIARIDDLYKDLAQIEPQVAELSDQKLLLEQQTLSVCHTHTVYGSLEAAYDHRNSVTQLERELLRLNSSVNPYVQQHSSLSNTLQEVSYDELNELTSLKDHQEFLLKLLTNKDSFIRKRIIDQNLAFLNHRLNEYLNTLGIAHAVKFQNDLSVEIIYMAQDMDLAQLSRGESTRLILALSWSFRDMFENMNTGINFMGIDELIDAGLDSAGVERAIELLKGMARDRNKNIFLISHREELISRASNTLTVVKEDGFTKFCTDWESA
mgnify:CR=1 FL=1